MKFRLTWEISALDLKPLFPCAVVIYVIKTFALFEGVISKRNKALGKYDRLKYLALIESHRVNTLHAFGNFDGYKRFAIPKRTGGNHFKGSGKPDAFKSTVIKHIFSHFAYAVRKDNVFKLCARCKGN